MIPVLVDSNVILDVVTEDPEWGEWSASALEKSADASVLVVNPVIYAEVSIGFKTIEALEEVLPPEYFRREPVPWEAAFLAGKCFVRYRRSKGLPGEHASRLFHRGPCGDMRVPPAHPRRRALPHLLPVGPPGHAVMFNPTSCHRA